jgi:large subunit ribosomal protein L24
MNRINKNDVVEVISGNHAGKRGKVIEIDATRALVEGVNRVWKHLRRSQQHPHGARIQKEAPIPVARLAVVCPACSKAAKVGYKKTEGGEKARVCRKCKAEIASSHA